MEYFLCLLNCRSYGISNVSFIVFICSFVFVGIKEIKIIYNNPSKQSEDQYGGDPSEDVGAPLPPVIDQQPIHVSPYLPADRHHSIGFIKIFHDNVCEVQDLKVWADRPGRPLPGCETYFVTPSTK